MSGHRVRPVVGGCSADPRRDSTRPSSDRPALRPPPTAASHSATHAQGVGSHAKTPCRSSDLGTFFVCGRALRLLTEVCAPPLNLQHLLVQVILSEPVVVRRLPNFRCDLGDGPLDLLTGVGALHRPRDPLRYLRLLKPRSACPTSLFRQPCAVVLLAPPLARWSTFALNDEDPVVGERGSDLALWRPSTGCGGGRRRCRGVARCVRSPRSPRCSRRLYRTNASGGHAASL